MFKRSVLVLFAFALMGLGTPARAASPHIGLTVSLDTDCSNTHFLASWTPNPNQQNITFTIKDLSGSGPTLQHGPTSIPSDQDHLGDDFDIPASLNGAHRFLATASIDDGVNTILSGSKRVRLPCDLT